jgi:hypothetical protein
MGDLQDMERRLRALEIDHMARKGLVRRISCKVCDGWIYVPERRIDPSQKDCRCLEKADG